MITLRQTLLFGLLLFAVNGFSQEQDTAFVNKLLQESKGFFEADRPKAMQLSEQALEISQRINYAKGEATALKHIGIVHYRQQQYLQTLDYWNQSLQIFRAEKDETGEANILNNIAAVYKDRGDDDRALDYALKSLKIAEKIKDNTRIYSCLITIASIYHNKRDPKALDYLIKAKSFSDKESYGVIDGNLGEVYFDLGEAIENKPGSAEAAKHYFTNALNYYELSLKEDSQGINTPFAYNGIGKVYNKQGKIESALQSHQKALAIAEKLEDKLEAFKASHGMANAYLKLGNNVAAFENYNKAQKLGELIETNDVADLYTDMAAAYKQAGDFKNALVYTEKNAVKEKEIYDAEDAKKLGRVQLDFDLYKKGGEVTRLTQEKKIEQQAKTGFAIGLGLILIIAVILFRNYKVKVKTNRVLDKQKQEIEGLLLNILPAEIAKELQASGRSAPRHHEDVAVLFTDFKGFTSIADRMPASDLVFQLNECFMAFDSIIEKYGLEKIKTIGDAYMCAAGIPSKGERNTHRIVKAAIEIQEWIKQNNERRVASGLEAWDIRIGVHTGSLVAGVVGKKKYAYDIWGTTVNIASRMESNGEPGRVNISAAAYDLIRNDFNCSYRGKINAKNIGDIDMYFVENEIDRSYRVIGAEEGMPAFVDTTLN